MKKNFFLGLVWSAGESSHHYQRLPQILTILYFQFIAIGLSNLPIAFADVPCEQIYQYNAPADVLKPVNGADNDRQWTDNHGNKWATSRFQIYEDQLTLNFVVKTKQYMFYTVHFTNNAVATYRSSQVRENCEHTIHSPAADVAFIEAKA
jgi:hypothetical protein